jgi:hypothetical protein
MHLLLLIFLAASAGLFASVGPSFMLNYSVWDATDIVMVVTIGQDGVFEVTESWKGALDPGFRISIPQLAPSAGEDIRPWTVGGQMVLFLKRSVSEGLLRWAPAGPLKEFPASAVWLRGGEVYRFVPGSNPRVSLFAKSKLTEAEFRARVAEVLRVREDMDAIILEPAELRATHLKKYASSEISPAKQFALRALGNAGASGLNVFRELLDAASSGDDVSMLVQAYATAGGVAVAEDLDLRLRHLVELWRVKTSPVQPGWWDAGGTAMILALQRLHYVPAAGTARELKAIMEQLPKPFDSASTNLIVTACDELIRYSTADPIPANMVH